MTQYRTGLIAAALLGAIGAALYEARMLPREQAGLAALRVQQATLDAEVAKARRLRDEAAHDAALLKDALATAPASQPDDAAEGSMTSWKSRLKRLRQLIAERPELGIPENKLLDEKDWLEVAQHARFDSEEHVRDAAAELRRKAKETFAGLLHGALEKYTKAHHGDLPASPLDLLPECDHRIEAGMLQRYAMMRTGKVGDFNEAVVTERSPLDPERDGKVSIGVWSTEVEADHVAVTLPPDTDPLLSALISDVVMPAAVTAYRKQHDGQFPGGEADLSDYLESAAASIPVMQDIHQAGERYEQAHPRAPLHWLKDLRPYTNDPARFDELIARLSRPKASAGK